MRSIVLTNGMACATSGEYERGKHIYDGRTGLAVTNNLVSVTVVHPSSAMVADGLSTTLFVLGVEAGERFLKAHHPEATAYWIVRP
jgi:thiamine biosynthesis lipoprotein